MNTIHVKNIIPSFLQDTTKSSSEVWHSEALFKKEEYTLVAAVSGTGKSSLLSYLFGERSDYTGDILYDAQKVNTIKSTHWSEIRQREISFVFQGLRLFSELTAFENIIAKNRLTNHKTDAEIIEMIELSGLGDKKDLKAKYLSFGQQQRIAIIRALCQPFNFLLLDEPFSHLDNENIAIMTTMILHELEAQNAGMILCSLGYEYLFTYHHKLKL